MKYIALVDCNNFFVSCEILFNPTLAGKPVCVLSNNDGCVVARSNEAKKLGITMGMPHFMAKVQYPQAIYLSGNHPLYNDISSRIMKRLYDFTPNVEQYSVDEAFLDLSGTKRLYHTTYQSLIEEIRLDIKNHIGIPVSIGLGGSKVQAKLASELAKKNGGIFHITQETQEKILKTPPLKMFGE